MDCTPPRHSGFTQVPDFRRKSDVRRDQSGFASQEAFESKLLPPPTEAYCLLSNGPQFAHVEVFNSDGKLISLSAIPVTF